VEPEGGYKDAILALQLFETSFSNRAVIILDFRLKFCKQLVLIKDILV